MIKQVFEVRIVGGAGISPDILKHAMKHICLQYGFLDFAGVERIEVDEVHKSDDMCPHGYFDWDLCPDCCH